VRIKHKNLWYHIGDLNSYYEGLNLFGKTDDGHGCYYKPLVDKDVWLEGKDLFSSWGYP